RGGGGGAGPGPVGAGPGPGSGVVRGWGVGDEGGGDPRGGFAEPADRAAGVLDHGGGADGEHDGGGQQRRGHHLGGRPDRERPRAGQVRAGPGGRLLARPVEPAAQPGPGVVERGGGGREGAAGDGHERAGGRTGRRDGDAGP